MRGSLTYPLRVAHRPLSKRMLRDPGRGSKFWKTLDREISEPRKDRGQIVTHGNS